MPDFLQLQSTTGRPGESRALSAAHTPPQAPSVDLNALVGQGDERFQWIRKNAYYYEDLRRFFTFHVEKGRRVLEIGFGTGPLLEACNPSKGMGPADDPRRRSHRYARGSSVVSRANYARIAAGRSYFGDFDLIFGASKLDLEIAEVPVRYRERVYGQTNISRWKHGWLLLKMCVYARWAGSSSFPSCGGGYAR